MRQNKGEFFRARQKVGKASRSGLMLVDTNLGEIARFFAAAWKEAHLERISAFTRGASGRLLLLSRRRDLGRMKGAGSAVRAFRAKISRRVVRRLMKEIGPFICGGVGAHCPVRPATFGGAVASHVGQA